MTDRDRQLSSLSAGDRAAGDLDRLAIFSAVDRDLLDDAADLSRWLAGIHKLQTISKNVNPHIA